MSQERAPGVDEREAIDLFLQCRPGNVTVVPCQSACRGLSWLVGARGVEGRGGSFDPSGATVLVGLHSGCESERPAVPWPYASGRGLAN